MIEGIPTPINIARNTPVERFKLVHIKNFPSLPDMDGKRETAFLSATQGKVGLTLAQLDQREQLRIEGLEEECSYLRYIMLAVRKVSEGFTLTPIPGVHDITGYNSEEWNHPYERFQSILEKGYFIGGEYCNVYLVGGNPRPHFNEFRHQGNHAFGRIVISTTPETSGDRYRLMLWSGFSENYGVSLEDGRSFGYGTVRITPLSRIEPFIVLAKSLNSADIEERIAFYKEQLGKFNLPNPIQILNYGYEDITTISGD